MALVTVERYALITGDTVSSASQVSARIEDAVALLEEELGRPLASVERTEDMWPTRDGMLWPRATPVTVAPDDYTINGYGLTGAGAWPSGVNWFTGPSTPVSVTYTGGYVERTANPTATNRLPACIERDLAWAAYRLGHPATALSFVPAGASSVSLGDASISWGSGGAPGAAADLLVGAWSRQTLAYRYVRVGGDPA